MALGKAADKALKAYAGLWKFMIRMASCTWTLPSFAVMNLPPGFCSEETSVFIHGTDKSTDGSALVKASKWGQGNLVRLFIELGANVDTASLFEAMHHGHEDVVRILIDAGAKFPRDKSFIPELMASTRRDQRVISIAKLLLDHGANLEATNAKGRTALVAAVLKNNLTIARFLIDQGANIEAATARTGHTPLVAALSRGYLSVAASLLERGAKIDAAVEDLMRRRGLQLPTADMPCTE